MPHPFFDCRAYPWKLPEAATLHEAVYTHIHDPDDITLIYQTCGLVKADLVVSKPPRLIWKQALDGLAAACALRKLETELVKRQTKQIDEALDAIRNLRDPLRSPVLLSNQRLFLDRTILRTELERLALPSGGPGVLLVRGNAKSGKSWTRHMVEAQVEALNETPIPILPGLVGSVEDVIDLIFFVIGGKPPKVTQSVDAWYRKVCGAMMDAAEEKKRAPRFWLIADDIGHPRADSQSMDPQILTFLEQIGRSMAIKPFYKWFRLVLLDYPETPIPTTWEKGYFTEDRARAEEIDQIVVSAFLRDWAQQTKKKDLLESDELAASILVRAQKPRDDQDHRSHLERIHDEVKEALEKL